MSFYSLQTRLTTQREGFLHTRVWSKDYQNACLWRGRVPRIRSNYDQRRWRWNCQLAKLGGMYKVRKCHSLVFRYKLNRLLMGRASCITMMLLAHQSPHAGHYQTLHKNHKPNRTLLDFVYCFPKPLVDMCKIRWATQQREAVHHKEMPGVDHMGILRQLQPAQEIAAIIENLNNQLYEDVKYLNVEDYPKVEVLV